MTSNSPRKESTFNKDFPWYDEETGGKEEKKMKFTLLLYFNLHYKWAKIKVLAQDITVNGVQPGTVGFVLALDTGNMDEKSEIQVSNLKWWKSCFF